MIDEVDYASPLGLLGHIADALFLKNYMTRFLLRHNAQFKWMAETKVGGESLLEQSQGDKASKIYVTNR